MEDKGTNPAGSGGTRRWGKAQPSVGRRLLDAGELGGILAVVRDSDVWWAVKCCVLFMAFTCVRGNEARSATWEEVDLDKAEWTIPAIRMKSGVPHRVPLSTHAVEVLDYIRKQGGGQGLIFPSWRGGTVMGSGMLSLISRRLEIPAVPRGIRPSFVSWSVGRADIPVLVVERVLGHVRPSNGLQGQVPSDCFEQRQNVMQEWADFLTETMGPVVPADPDRR